MGGPVDMTGPRGASRRDVEARTEVLDVPAAGAVADPGAVTQALWAVPAIRGDQPEGVDAATDVPAGGPRPLVSRRVAAEIGMYLGAGLIAVAVGGPVARGWAAWEPVLQWAFVGLATVALLAAGLFVRLPWRRVPSDQRRRAVSAMLTTGVTCAAAGVASASGMGAGSVPGGSRNASIMLGVVVAMLVVNLVARTPLSETVLLVAAAWAAWSVVPPGPGTWALLAALGVLWAGLGMRWARGRRTAGVLGALLGLVALVGMATGPWAWPTRAGLAVAAVLGLVAFVRGRANAWLALGAGASTALAASVAGDVVQPALALLVGGLATMIVSWIALRSAGET